MARLKWLTTARPEQITPPGDWETWLLKAGRGFGKTRVGAEDAVWYCGTNERVEYAVVAPTFTDVQKTCFEGVSGILSIIPECLVKDYNRSEVHLTLKNGSSIRGFSAEKADRLRGPQFHRAWCDETAAWKNSDAWDMLQFGLRLGVHPQVLVTTTPRPKPLIKEMIADEGTVVTNGSTMDNAKNLSRKFIDRIKKKYEGTRLGRQELYAEMLDDLPGALWTREMLDSCLVDELPPMDRIVVAVDPSGRKDEEDTGDSIGIVVAGYSSRTDMGYLLEDASCREGPAGWGRRAVHLYHKWQADRIVGENNFGGAMVEHTIRSVDADVSYAAVNASRGKVLRAEPVSALYEQGRVKHHYRYDETDHEMWNELNDQLCQFGRFGWTGKGSPDRADAMVWAITDLMLQTPEGYSIEDMKRAYA